MCRNGAPPRSSTSILYTPDADKVTCSGKSFQKRAPAIADVDSRVRWTTGEEGLKADENPVELVERLSRVTLSAFIRIGLNGITIKIFNILERHHHTPDNINVLLGIIKIVDVQTSRCTAR